MIHGRDGRHRRSIRLDGYDYTQPGAYFATICAHNQARLFGEFVYATPGPANVMPGSLGAIVRAFKSATTRRINLARGMRGTLVWQRNYYEHIIRDEVSLQRICDYITANPARWAVDIQNPENLRAANFPPQSPGKGQYP